jgi:flagellar protein FlaG
MGMSSDNISIVQSLDIARVQGLQSAAQPPKSEEVTAVERNESAAAAGQDMPPGQTGDPADVKQYESAVSKISDFVQNFQRDLLFSIDKDSDRLVVKVVDSQTQEVIRQIPSEETLRIARNLDSPESLIFREQA